MYKNPRSMRFTCVDTQERIADAQKDQATLDTLPLDLDGKGAILRRREPEKELAHSKFRHKSFSTVDKLNTMYENDWKILDCEALLPKPKKRFSMAQATRRFITK